MSRTEDKKTRALRDAQKRDKNKRCADCLERLPNYICTDYSTFVCTQCSGIHREFNHRVKSISLANFTDDEVRAVRAGGNDKCNDLYLAKYDPQRHMPEPDGSSVEKRREFIRAKYEDKRWYATPDDLVREIDEREQREAARARREETRHSRRSSASSTTSSRRSSAVSIQPISKVLAGGTMLEVKRQEHAPPAPPANDFLDLLSAPAALPQQQQQYRPSLPQQPVQHGIALPLPPSAAGPQQWATFNGYQPQQQPQQQPTSVQPQYTPQPQQQQQAPWNAFGSPQLGAQQAPNPFGAAPTGAQPFNLQQPQQQPSTQQQLQQMDPFAAFTPQPPTQPPPQQQPQYSSQIPQQQQQPLYQQQQQPFQQHYPQQQHQYQQHQQQQPQNGYAAHFGANGSGSAAPTPPAAAGIDLSDPFAAITLGDASSSASSGSTSAAAPALPPQRPYVAGEKVMYVKGSDAFPAVVLKAHPDLPNPPFYTVKLTANGQEKNTDHNHLRRLSADGSIAAPAPPSQQSKPKADMFAFADPFASVKPASVAAAAAPVAPPALPQHAALEPQQFQAQQQPQPPYGQQFPPQQQQQPQQHSQPQFQPQLQQQGNGWAGPQQHGTPGSLSSGTGASPGSVKSSENSVLPVSGNPFDLF